LQYFPACHNNPHPGWYKGKIVRHVYELNYKGQETRLLLNEVHYEDGDVESVDGCLLEMRDQVKILSSPVLPIHSSNNDDSKTGQHTKKRKSRDAKVAEGKAEVDFYKKRMGDAEDAIVEYQKTKQVPPDLVWRISQEDRDQLLTLCSSGGNWDMVLYNIQRNPLLGTVTKTIHKPTGQPQTSILHMAISDSNVEESEDRAKVILEIIHHTPRMAAVQNQQKALPIHSMCSRSVIMTSKFRHQAILELMKVYPQGILQKGPKGKTPVHQIQLSECFLVSASVILCERNALHPRKIEIL